MVQFVSMFSLMAFAFADSLPLCVFSLLPFLISAVAVSIGLVKMKEGHLIPFVPIYLTLDAVVSFACLMAARLLNILRKEVRWVRLSKGKHYHHGTPIKINYSY